MASVKSYVHFPAYMNLPERRETPPQASEVKGRRRNARVSQEETLL